MSPRLGELPPELICEALSHCSSGTLATCSLANKQVSEFALDCLYSTLYVESAEVSRLLAASPPLHRIQHLKADVNGSSWTKIPFSSWTVFFEKLLEHRSLISLEITSCPVTFLNPTTVTALRDLACLATLQSMCLSITYSLIHQRIMADIRDILASSALRYLHVFVADTRHGLPETNASGTTLPSAKDSGGSKKIPILHTLELSPLCLKATKLQNYFDLSAVQKFAVIPDVVALERTPDDYQRLSNGIIGKVSSSVRHLLLELPGTCPDGYFPNIQPYFPLQTFTSLEYLTLILAPPLQDHGVDEISRGQQKQAIKALESIPSSAPWHDLTLYVPMRRGSLKPTISEEGWSGIAFTLANRIGFRRVHLYFGQPSWVDIKDPYFSKTSTVLSRAVPKKEQILDIFHASLGRERVLVPSTDYVDCKLVRRKFFER